MGEKPGYLHKEQHRFRLYGNGVLIPAVKGATGNEEIVTRYFLFLHQ